MRAIWLLALCLVGASASAWSATGEAVAALAEYDQRIQALMQRWHIPGAAVAVARKGRLVFARGYGVTERDGSVAVQPDALFRIASLSKPLTATAVMRLVQDGQLALDQRVFPLLDVGEPVDPRLNRITVRHLLQHSGGWDRAIAGDFTFDSVSIARAMGVASPPDAPTILRYALRLPLQFDPGTRFAYSNFGYLVLGQLIEKVSGQRYEDVVRGLLREAGVTRMRLGASLPAGRLPGEVGYAMPIGHPLVSSVFDSLPGKVPSPYGGFAIEPRASQGGWVASAIDLVAFGTAMDGDPTRRDLLGAEAFASIGERPAYAGAKDSNWYGLGWFLHRSGSRFHHGDQPGVRSYLSVQPDGTVWALLLNASTEGMRGNIEAEMQDAMGAAWRSVAHWPAGDAFAAMGIAEPASAPTARPR